LTEIKIVKAHTIEIDPTKRYLFVFDESTITLEDVHNFLGMVEGMGVKHPAVGLTIRGKPESEMKVIEWTENQQSN
jgi:hypothetical protein